MRLPTITFLLCATVAALAQTPAAQTDEFQRLETVWNQAHVKGDAAALERLWADDLEIAVPRMPILTKASASQFAHSGRMHFERYETSDLKVRVYGDAAVVTGRLQRTRTIDGKKTDDDWRFTKVYTRQAGEWKVVSFHASEAAQP